MPALTTSYRYWSPTNGSVGARPTRAPCPNRRRWATPPSACGEQVLLPGWHRPAVRPRTVLDRTTRSRGLRGPATLRCASAGPQRRTGLRSLTGCWPSPGRQVCRPSRPGASWRPASTGTAPTAGAGWTAANRPQLAAQIDPARREPTHRAVRSGRRAAAAERPRGLAVAGSAVRSAGPSRRGVGGVPGPHPREPRGAREA